MSGVPAVFVDGTGHVRHRTLEYAHASYRLPIVERREVLVSLQDRIVAYEAAFERLGQLPDGRHVYGYQFDAALSPFNVWHCDVRTTREITADGLLAMVEQTFERLDFLQPFVCLYSRFTVEADGYRWRMVGVARKPVR